MDNYNDYNNRYQSSNDIGRRGYENRNDEDSRSGANPAGIIVGTLLLGVGAYLVYQGISQNQERRGRRQNRNQSRDQSTQHVRESVTINKPASELYHYWRHLSNLSDIMSHLESVTEKTATRSHWVARGPVGTSVEWDAEVTQDVENQLIAWKAVEDADVQNEGNVTFTEAPGGRGTEVRVNLTYHPPGGQLGAAVAKLFGEEPSQQLSDDLRRFKQRMETGVTATTQGQPSGS